MKIKMLPVALALMMSLSTSYAESYLGLKIGKSWLDTSCTQDSDQCIKSNPSYGLFLGYEMNKYLSFETTYENIGQFNTLRDDKTYLYGFSLAPKLSLDILDEVSWYAKVGGIYNYAEDWNTSFYTATGFEFLLDKNLSLRLEYQMIPNINNGYHDIDMNTASVGVQYKFNNDNQPITPITIQQDIEKPKPLHVIDTFNVYDDFKFDNSDLSDKNRQEINKVLIAMDSDLKMKISIIGHTDSTGPIAYNLKLSKKRAQAVADVFLNSGISSSRISIEGKGLSLPISENNTAVGRAKNRRVEIIVHD